MNNSDILNIMARQFLNCWYGDGKMQVIFSPALAVKFKSWMWAKHHEVVFIDGGLCIPIWALEED